MLVNGIWAAGIQILFAGFAYWAIGWNGQGAIAEACPDQAMLQRMLALLIPWLSGMVYFLVGYRLRSLHTQGKNFISVAWPTFLAGVAALGAAIFSLVGEGLGGAGFFYPLQGLALPFVPLLSILQLPVYWPEYMFLAIFGPLLIFSGMQIRLDKQGKRGIALGVLIGYLLLLLLLPVIGLMLYAV